MPTFVHCVCCSCKAELTISPTQIRCTSIWMLRFVYVLPSSVNVWSVFSKKMFRADVDTTTLFCLCVFTLVYSPPYVVFVFAIYVGSTCANNHRPLNVCTLADSLFTRYMPKLISPEFQLLFLGAAVSQSVRYWAGHEACSHWDLHDEALLKGSKWDLTQSSDLTSKKTRTPEALPMAPLLQKRMPSPSRRLREVKARGIFMPCKGLGACGQSRNGPSCCVRKAQKNTLQCNRTQGET